MLVADLWQFVPKIHEIDKIKMFADEYFLIHKLSRSGRTRIIYNSSEPCDDCGRPGLRTYHVATIDFYVISTLCAGCLTHPPYHITALNLPEYASIAVKNCRNMRDVIIFSTRYSVQEYIRRLAGPLPGYHQLCYFCKSTHDEDICGRIRHKLIIIAANRPKILLREIWDTIIFLFVVISAPVRYEKLNLNVQK